jgi:hypothetical protein
MTLERGRTGAGWKQTPPEHTPRPALEAQGTHYWVCRWGMVAAQR